VPFAVTTGRRGALYGVGLAIMLAIAYFLLTAVFAAAGKATVLPPMLAAWAPNVFFLIAAAYLTLKVRT
jgi:lipopolysaccharide export LptBFGC system permease protein LptF